jgi:hypothetical protein
MFKDHDIVNVNPEVTFAIPDVCKDSKVTWCPDWDMSPTLG